MIRPFSLLLIVTTALIAHPAFAQDDWRFADHAPDLRAASCTDGAIDADTIALTATPVALGPQAAVADALPDGVRFAGGWALASDDARFGGLSGLATLGADAVLGISDMGRAVRIDMQDGKPSGTATLHDLRHASGRSLSGKLTGDAEGLAWRDGIALVSFERDFRVLAFDMGTCGAAARGIPVAAFPARFGRTRVRANAGPESLELGADGRLHVGFEQPREGRVVTGTVTKGGSVRLSGEADGAVVKEGFRHVGADTITLTDGRIATARLLRAYERRRGNRVRLHVMLDGDDRTITLAAPLAVDNFEGVALHETDDGLRVTIVSDDNFSDRQRTLLFAFDLRTDVLPNRASGQTR